MLSVTNLLGFLRDTVNKYTFRFKLSVSNMLGFLRDKVNKYTFKGEHSDLKVFASLPCVCPFVVHQSVHIFDSRR